MMRLFKPGDRVQLKTGGPVMEVMRYATKVSPILGVYESNHHVECVWFDPKEGRRTAVFHQNSLMKASWVKRKNTVGYNTLAEVTLASPSAGTVHEGATKEVLLSADTLADAIAFLNQQGFKKEFVALAEGLRNLESKKVYPPESVSIMQVFRFEGYSDIDDMSVLYAIACDDGTKGWIADAYGIYANPDLAGLLMRMKDDRTQKERQKAEWVYDDLV